MLLELDLAGGLERLGVGRRGVARTRKGRHFRRPAPGAALEAGGLTGVALADGRRGGHREPTADPRVVDVVGAVDVLRNQCLAGREEHVVAARRRVEVERIDRARPGREQLHLARLVLVDVLRAVGGGRQQRVRGVEEHLAAVGDVALQDR